MASDNLVEPSSVRNIVLDLGGVLYAIDPSRTSAALARLAGPRCAPISHDHPLFWEFEMGLCTMADFRDRLRNLLDSEASDTALDAAWNALLLGPIAGRVDWVRQLAQRYRVILLSNTNTIHEKVWAPQCAELFGAMERTWFSFDLGMRKPHAEIYQHVLDQMGMSASESLFVDDSAGNLVGAKAVGMHTLLIDPQDPDQFANFCLKFLDKV